MAIVHGIASLTLVSHRIWIAHVHSCPVAHEPIHALVSHLSLVEPSERRNLHFGLVLGAAAQAKRSRSRMPYVPEIVASLLGLHVNA